MAAEIITVENILSAFNNGLLTATRRRSGSQLGMAAYRPKRTMTFTEMDVGLCYWDVRHLGRCGRKI